jgi:hypothetical protein
MNYATARSSSTTAMTFSQPSPAADRESPGWYDRLNETRATRGMSVHLILLAMGR